VHVSGLLHGLTAGNVVALVLMGYGFTFLVQDATIFDAPRAFVRRAGFIDRLIGCSFCVGFWSGGLLALVDVVLRGAVLPDSIVQVLAWGLLVAASSFLLDVVTQSLEAGHERR
jgi:hypothetical protein